MKEIGDAPRIFGRSLIMRCPRCGEGKLMKSWFTTNTDCSNCHLFFDHEEGFWIGAIFVNLITTMVLIILGMLYTINATDLSMWTQIIVLAIFGLVFPIVFYPVSLSIWLAMNYFFTDMEKRTRKRSRY